jgi:hypothetical protein
MKKIAVITLLIILSCGVCYAAQGYLEIEGSVKSINGKYLIFNDSRDREPKDQLYPISAFVQVFDKNGKPSGLAPFANAGFINKAKLYLLRGKVEKIVVEDMQQ